jgi:hypothetical protein
MNLPDAAEARGLECAEQNTRGESNPAHFSVTKDLAEDSVSDRCSLPAISQVPLWALPCPLSAQPAAKTDAENPQVNR